MQKTLSTGNHSRDIAGLKYVYPVMSRRAGGLSIGINFNPNNACNWRCIYCQVPDLQRGAAPEMDFAVLEHELRFFLQYVLNGEFFEQFDVPAAQRVIKDIAISGNGEPTSLQDFERAIALVGCIASEMDIFPGSHFVLISNGSLMHKVGVQAGIQALAKFGGEVWFKVDSATEKGRKLINNSAQSQSQLIQNLETASRLCATKLQTCMFHYNDQVWSEQEKSAYLQLLQEVKARQIGVEKVMLYNAARQSFQPEASQLEKATTEEMNRLAADIEALGYDVCVSV